MISQGYLEQADNADNLYMNIGTKQLKGWHFCPTQKVILQEKKILCSLMSQSAAWETHFFPTSLNN